MINIKKYSASKALDYIIRYKNNIYFYIIIIITVRIIYSLVKSNKYKKTKDISYNINVTAHDSYNRTIKKLNIKRIINASILFCLLNI